jgi:hypothetical protein
MAGPWDDYAPPAPKSGPWNDYEPEPSVGADVLKSAAIGIPKGIIGLVGASPAGIATELGLRGVNAAGNYLGLWPSKEVSVPAEIRKSVETVTGPLYDPKTFYGEYAQTGSEFLPAAAAGPGGIARRVIMGAAVPGVTSETAGQAARAIAPEAEPYARLVGAITPWAAAAAARRLFSGAPAATAEQTAGRIGREAVQADFPPPPGGPPGAAPPAMAARAAELGPTGFAGEAGANTRATLQGLVTEGGPAAQRIQQAYNARAAGNRPRIENAVTGAFGPRQDLAELQIGERMAQGLESSPLYDAFRTTQVHATPEIRALLPVLEQDGLLAEAVRRMKLEGRPVTENVFNTINLGRPGTPGPMGPTTEAWDYVKRAIDGRITAALNPTRPDRDLARIYRGVKERIDTAIANSNPDAANIWRQARDTWGSREALINAREEGTQLWTRGVRRDELRQELAGMPMPERLAFREGARDALAEMIDKSVNGDTQVARMLRAPTNIEKAHMLGANPGRTAEMLQEAQRVAAETDVHRRVLQNSETANRLAAAARLKPPEPPPGFLRTLNFGKPSTWIPYLDRALTARQAAADAARQQRANDILAQQLLQQGQPGQQSLTNLMQPPPPRSLLDTSLYQMVAPGAVAFEHQR